MARSTREVHALDLEPDPGRGPEHPALQGHRRLPDEPKRFVFQGVHMILDGDVQGEWKPGEKHTSKVVFIGRDLNEKAIREGFLACAARG